jgi:hypothetical protein
VAWSSVHLQTNTRAVRATLHYRAERLVDDTGKALVAETAARAPRSTVDEPDYVHLADSYTWDQTDETSGEMTTDKEYSVYQELGTVFQAGTPHVGPAAVAVQPQFAAGLERLFDG